MPVNIMRRLRVDGISICVWLSSKALFGKTVSALYKMKSAELDIVPIGDLQVVKGINRTRLDYRPRHDKKKIADIELAMAECGQKYFRLSLSPSQFQPGEFVGLKNALACWLSPFTYESLFYSGNVSRLDLAVDTLSHPMYSFIPFRAKASISSIYKGWSNEKGAIYCGSPKSKYLYRIYDKAKQLVETEGTKEFDQLTRIEVQIRSLGCSASGLTNLATNPFTRLEIADLQVAKKIFTTAAEQDFMWQCSTLGACKALSLLPKKSLRKDRLHKLRLATAPWWKPEAVWSNYAKALQVISL